MASHFRTWAAYQKGFLLAMNIDKAAARFPDEEKLRLIDQTRRSSSSVCANLGERFRKRRYPKHFVAKITDAAGENYETQVWQDFAFTRKYISKATYEKLINDSEEVGKLLTYMEHHPEHYANKLNK